MTQHIGFLLTRQWKDTQDGLSLRYWLHTASGPLLVEQKNQEGIFFVDTDHVEQAKKLIGETRYRTRELALKSFQQKPVTGFYFSQQRHLRQAARLLSEHGIEPLEADVRTIDRYLMERFITASMSVTSYETRCHDAGSLQTRSQEKNHDRFHYVSDVSLKAADYQPEFKLLSFDIETAYPSNTILSIAVYSADAQKVFMIGADQDMDSPTDISPIQWEMLADERRLLIRFMAWLAGAGSGLPALWTETQYRPQQRTHRLAHQPQQ